MALLIKHTVAFGNVRSARVPVMSRRTVAARAAFKITLKTPKGDRELECPDDTYILDAAEAENIDLPYSCRGGACSSCVGRILSGTVDQSEQQFLDGDQLAKGFVLTCVAYPTSDVVIATDQVSAL